VFGPISIDDGYRLYKVNQIRSASLDDVRDEVRLELYRVLVEELKSEAEIEYLVFTDEE